MNLKEWFRIRKEKKERAHFERGFNYAIGAIARGEKTPLALEAEHIESTWDSFDVGINSAIAYAIRHDLVEDDRF